MANLFESARNDRVRAREIKEQVIALKPAKVDPARKLGEALAGSVEDASEHMKIQPEYHQDNAMLAAHATDPIHPNYNHSHYLLGVIREMQTRLNDYRFGSYPAEGEKVKNDPTPLYNRKPNIGRYQQAQEHLDAAHTALSGYEDEHGNHVPGHWELHDKGDGVGALASLIKAGDHIQLAANSINEVEKPRPVLNADGEPQRDSSGKLVMGKGKNPRTLGDADSFLNREDESATGLAFTPLASFGKLSLGKRLSTVVNSYRSVAAKHNPKTEGVVKQLSRNYKLGEEPPVDAVEDLTDDEFSRSAAEADLRIKARESEKKEKARIVRKGVPSTLPLDHPTRQAMEAQKQAALDAEPGPSRYQESIKREADIGAYAEHRANVSKKATKLMTLQMAAASAKGEASPDSLTVLENRALKRAARITPPVDSPTIKNFDEPAEFKSPLSDDAVSKYRERDAPLAGFRLMTAAEKKAKAKADAKAAAGAPSNSKPEPTPEIKQAEADRESLLAEAPETEEERQARYAKEEAPKAPRDLAEHFGLGLSGGR
jgi:hypothetical protein